MDTLIQPPATWAIGTLALPETTEEEGHDLLAAVREGAVGRGARIMPTDSDSVRAAVDTGG